MRLTFKSNNPFTGEIQYYPDAVYDDKNTGDKMINFNKQTECNNKLGQLEDIEERLSKYKDIGICGLINLFKNLTDEDIEYIVQLAFKKREIIYEINEEN